MKLKWKKKNNKANKKNITIKNKFKIFKNLPLNNLYKLLWKNNNHFKFRLKFYNLI